MTKPGWGERIKIRARELGLTDAAVARALGLAQRRYSAYANGTREPDFLTFSRICNVLGTTPDVVLGFEPSEPPEPKAASLLKLQALLDGMTETEKLRTLAVVEALAAHPDGGPVDNE